jgi:hypothetical protein
MKIALAAWFPRDGRRRHAAARRVDGGHADIAIVDRGARRREIPDVHARAALDANGDLDRRIPDEDVASNLGVGRGSGDHDAVRVADGRVLVNAVAVAVEDADAEVVVGS